MSKLLFTKDHEWLKIDDDTAYIGITEYAQSQLGDIIFVELPTKNEKFNSNDVFGTIEAVKTVADIYMPISGKIVELNDALNDRPETVNNYPFNDGWILKLQITDMDEVSDLMDLEKYKTFIS